MGECVLYTDLFGVCFSCVAGLVLALYLCLVLLVNKPLPKLQRKCILTSCLQAFTLPLQHHSKRWPHKSLDKLKKLMGTRRFHLGK